MSDKPVKSYNHILIPTQKEARRKVLFENSSAQKAENGMFVVAPCSSVDDSKRIAGKTPKDEGKASAGTTGANATADLVSSVTTKGGANRMTGGNYAEKYKEKQIQNVKAAEAKKVKEIDSLATGQQTAEEMTQRGRASQLNNQISAWKAKLGSGEMDDAAVQANIQQLEREYFTIDYKYRPQ